MHQSSVQGGSNATRTSLEQFDTFSKVTSLILKNQDVADWTVEDVAGWVKTNTMLEPYQSTFNQNEIDGYTLLNLTEDEMINSLKINDQYHRQYLTRAIKKLVVVWIRYGKNCENFFREQADSIYFDEQTLINQTLNEDGNSTGAFSLVKMMEQAETQGEKTGNEESDQNKI